MFKKSFQVLRTVLQAIFFPSLLPVSLVEKVAKEKTKDEKVFTRII